MSHKLIILVIMVVCTVPYSVCGSEPLKEEQIERLVRQNPKEYLPKLIEFNEAKLERVYQTKLRASDPKYCEALKAAQEAWRTFYQADRVVGTLDTMGGSGAAIFAMERRVYQLRLRIYQLSTDYQQGWITIPTVDEPITK